MPKTLNYKRVDQKYLITTNPTEIPVGSIIFWHDHHVVEKANAKQPGKHLISPELITHVGIVIDYEGQYPRIAHAAYEKATASSKSNTIKSVIACRLRAVDEKFNNDGNSFIVFKPNNNNYEHRKVNEEMVNIAKKITFRDPETKKNDYHIPYGRSRSETMSERMDKMFGQKPKKVKFEKYLKDVTQQQLQETQYAFYNPWDYKSVAPKKIITEAPLNMRAAALVPFKNMIQYNNKDYQKYQQENNRPAFTKKGFMCVQFIVWLGQCAMIQTSYEGDKLTENIKDSTHDVADIAHLSRKYTKKEDPEKIHVKRFLLEGTGAKKLYSEQDYKDLFTWLDYDGKVMAPGTLMQILLDQSDGGGGSGEKPYMVDYYRASNENSTRDKSIIKDIGELITILEIINLKHDNTILDTKRFLLNCFRSVVSGSIMANTQASLAEMVSLEATLRLESMTYSRNQVRAISFFGTPETQTHNRFTEQQYLGIFIKIMASIFLKSSRSISRSVSTKKRKQSPGSDERKHQQIRRLGL